ncbi:hypothetical protein AB1Y20_008906 [Prymnesium parvum]|uniref:Uncharacterized protein n=1 Tax=Prymnesium parvum TaxID=97485 RepID=A0AB34K339_PRYPA
MAAHFYLNITILSTEAMLDSKIPGAKPASTGTSGKGFFSRHPVRSALHSAAVKGASTVLTGSRVAKKMGPKLVESMPKKMAEKGINAVVELKLVQGPYIVLKVTIKEVSAQHLLTKLGETNAKAAEVGNCLLACLPVEVLKKIQEEALAKKIATKMASVMGPHLTEEMGEKGLEVLAEGVAPSDQGEYLLEHLAALAPQSD